MSIFPHWMSLFPYWAIDASSSANRDGLFCFVPVEGFEAPDEFTVIWGLNILSDAPPAGGILIGVLHPGGNKAAQSFVDAHALEVERLIAQYGRNEVQP